jgi:hypothetical protein
MAPLLKIGILTLAVITGCCVVAVLVVPARSAAEEERRVDALRLVHMLDTAAHAYRVAEGEFPPGDGEGSAGLSEALAKTRECGRPYVSFSPAMLTGAGDIRNPVDPDREILRYRDNTRVRGAVGARHSDGFDLWGRDGEGREDGIANWRLGGAR